MNPFADTEIWPRHPDILAICIAGLLMQWQKKAPRLHAARPQECGERLGRLTKKRRKPKNRLAFRIDERGSKTRQRSQVPHVLAVDRFFLADDRRQLFHLRDSDGR